MKVLSTNVLKGPNFWSISRHKLIQLLLKNETHTSFTETNAQALVLQLKEALGIESSVKIHKHSPLPYIIAQVALALQKKGGITTDAFYRVQPTIRNEEYQVIFSYNEEKAGVYAGKAAVELVQALLSHKTFNVEAAIKEIRELWNALSLGPSTCSIVKEAQKRGIPVMRLDEGSFIQLGYGARQQWVQATITSKTSCIAVDIAGNKHETKRLLTAAGIPAPDGRVIKDVENLKAAVAAIGFPLVVKPLNANQGKGATTNINCWDDALKSFEMAQKFSAAVVVEKFIQGDDYRVLVVNNRFVAAARRTPAAVTGDGNSTIKELINAVNKDPNRGTGHECLLTAIKPDEDTLEVLSRQNCTLDTVLPMGKKLFLKSTANLSTGGTATDVTEDIHPANIQLFERAARLIGLDVCGIDVMAPDLATPIKENGGAIIELNAAPGLRMHLQPTEGARRNVAKPIVDMLFQKGNGRIPIVAITGTNGKTTSTRLVAHMAQHGGFVTGFTTTDGIYVNGELITGGDCSGPRSGEVVLKEKTVEFAVLETARGGLLRSGLCFDECDCAIVTNVAEDHLGLNEINTLEDLAKVKAVVAESVAPHGYAILNADDDLVYAMKDRVCCNVALFSLYPNNIRIQKHCEAGGLAAYCEDGYIMLQKGNQLIPVEEVKHIPITFNGKAEFNIANVLGACLAAYTSKINIDAIRNALISFIPSGEMTPGRVNLFQFDDYAVMIDYAHNPHGLRALGKLISSFEAPRKIGVIAGVGDRRNEDIKALGEEAARIFDEIIIRFDKDLRGRTADDICNLLKEGIAAVDANKSILCLADEMAAVNHILRNAQANSFITFLTEDIAETYHQVKTHHEACNASIRAAV